MALYKKPQIGMYGVIEFISWLNAHNLLIKLHFPIVPMQTINIEFFGAIRPRVLAPNEDSPSLS